ncbi:MAG: O-antigen ligase family protein [bacterium]
MTFGHKYLNLYYFFLAAALPLVFIQKSEQAYYLPKMALLVTALQFYIPFFLSAVRMKMDIADKALFIFLCFYALGFINAPFLGDAALYFAEWAAAAAMFYYGRYFLGKKDIKKIIIFMLFSSFAAGIYAVVQAFGTDLSGWVTDFSGRAFSTFGNPDFLGGFLLLVIPVSLALYFSFGRLFLSSLCFIFLTGVLMFSQTRSSIVSFGFSFAVLLFLFPDYFKKAYKYILPGILAVFILVIVSGKYEDIGQRIGTISNIENESLRGRYEMWQAGLKMIGENMFAGQGIYSVKPLYYRYKVSDDYAVTDRLHNDYIEIAAESGIMALMFFMLFAGAVMFKLAQSSAYFSKMILAAFAGFFIHAFFNFPFYLPAEKAYFFILAASALRPKKEYSPQSARGWPAAGFTALAAGIPVIIMLCGSIYLNYGINYSNASKHKDSIYYLDKAAEFDPGPEPYYYLSGYYLNEKDISAASESVYSYLARFPYSKKGNIRAAVISSSAGNNEKALEYLNSFLKYYPGDTDAMNNKGKVLYLMGNIRSAVEEYKKVISIDPDNAAAYYNLYGIYANTGKTKEAHMMLGKYRELSGK